MAPSPSGGGLGWGHASQPAAPKTQYIHFTKQTLCKKGDTRGDFTMAPHTLSRRAFSLWAGAALAAPMSLARAQQQQPRPLIGDMHSHYTMFDRGNSSVDIRREMQDTGTALMAWAIVDDSPWIQAMPQGIKQVKQPQAGELWAYFQRAAGRYDTRLRNLNLPKALTPADVDAALAGTPTIVMASESANFLEGQPARVAQAHAMGLRHLQMVHYIDTPIGDLQTEAPRHNGMPPLALEVINECKRLGVLVDLAHCTPEFVDAALSQSDATVVWSHSWISRFGGTWKDYGHTARSLSPAQAKKIAARGGVIGLWTVRARGDSKYPVYSLDSYADEIMRMADIVGPEHVAFGTDMEGAGPNPVMTRYADLREVVNNLAKRGLPEATLNNICIGNYARALKKAMKTS